MYCARCIEEVPYYDVAKHICKTMPQKELAKPNPRNFKNRNKLTFHIKRDGMRNYRWDLVSRNGAILCSSPDTGYNRIGKCLASIAIVMENTYEAAIECPKELSILRATVAGKPIVDIFRS